MIDLQHNRGEAEMDFKVGDKVYWREAHKAEAHTGAIEQVREDGKVLYVKLWNGTTVIALPRECEPREAFTVVQDADYFAAEYAAGALAELEAAGK
jgi:hypothetical protein